MSQTHTVTSVHRTIPIKCQNGWTKDGTCQGYSIWIYEYMWDIQGLKVYNWTGYVAGGGIITDLTVITFKVLSS